MDAYKDHCVLAVRNNNNDESKPYTLIICNNINTTVDCKNVILKKTYCLKSKPIQFYVICFFSQTH